METAEHCQLPVELLDAGLGEAPDEVDRAALDLLDDDSDIGALDALLGSASAS
jgi:hypothetical protein